MPGINAFGVYDKNPLNYNEEELREIREKLAILEVEKKKRRKKGFNGHYLLGEVKSFPWEF